MKTETVTLTVTVQEARAIRAASFNAAEKCLNQAQQYQGREDTIGRELCRVNTEGLDVHRGIIHKVDTLVGRD